MSDAQQQFNPYLKWLGIRTASPDHYQLLGVERFESDPDVISSAADRQMAHVRKYQNGPQSAQSQVLLNELAAAKICLLTPEQKLDYDISLSTNQSIATASPRKRMGWRIAAGVSAVAALALFVWQMQGETGNSIQSDTIQTAANNSVDPVPASDQPGEGFGPTPIGADAPDEEPDAVPTPIGQQPTPDGQQPTPDGQQPTAGDPPASGDPLIEIVDPPKELLAEQVPSNWLKPPPSRRPIKKPPQTTKPIDKLRTAWFSRNRKAANAWMDKILQQSTTSDSPHEDQRQARWLELVHRKFIEFWEKYDLGLETLEAGDRLSFLGTSVVVTMKADGQLTLQADDGGSKSFNTNRVRVGPNLATAIVRSSMPSESPMLHAMLYVFWVTDKQGDLVQAKEHFDIAKLNGVPVEFLLAGKRAPTGQAATLPTTNGAETAPISKSNPPTSDQPANSKKRPIPSLDVQKTQLVRVRDAYSDLYADQSPAGMKRLAKKLLEEAHRSGDNADARFVMYEQTRELGIAVGDVATASLAIRAMAYNFECDARQLHVDMLTTIRRQLKPDDRPNYCTICLDEVEQLSQRHDYELAKKLLDLCLPIAKSSRDPTLRENGRQARDRLVYLRRQFESLSPNQQNWLRDSKPNSADQISAQDSLQIAMFLALDKGEFQAAAAEMTNTDDPLFVDIGRLEQSSPSEPTAQLALADLWWQAGDYAGIGNDRRRGAAIERARVWYRQALPKLDGISRRHATMRLAKENST